MSISSTISSGKCRKFFRVDLWRLKVCVCVSEVGCWRKFRFFVRRIETIDLIVQPPVWPRITTRSDTATIFPNPFYWIRFTKSVYWLHGMLSGTCIWRFGRVIGEGRTVSVGDDGQAGEQERTEQKLWKSNHLDRDVVVKSPAPELLLVGGVLHLFFIFWCTDFLARYCTPPRPPPTSVHSCHCKGGGEGWTTQEVAKAFFYRSGVCGRTSPLAKSRGMDAVYWCLA